MAKTLTVYLAADLKKFNGGMKDAQRQVTGFGGTLKNNLGPALIAAGAAAGAFAIKLGVDGVKAAAEDQKAIAALTTTLENLNLAHDTQAVEDYIYELERAYGVADTELRPAYDRLVRSTQDTAEANRVLKIAMDISAGTGKSLQTIVDNLGRAYDGNVEGLGRLGLGIDRTALKTMDFEDVLDTLATTFAGQADANARTFEGQLRRLQTATDNLKEAFGAGLLRALGDTENQTQDFVDTMADLEPLIQEIGEKVGDFGTDLVYLASSLTDVVGWLNQSTDGLQIFGQELDITAAKLFTSPLRIFTDGLRELRAQLAGIDGDRLFQDLIAAQREAADQFKNSNFQVQAANRYYQDAAVRADRLASEQSNVAEQTSNVGSSSRGAAQATDQLTKKQQKLIDLYEVQGIAFATTKSELLSQIQTLKDATDAVENYATAIQQDLLGGLNLETLYQGAVNEQGTFVAQDFLKGFDEAINQAEWFGNVLTAIKQRGADQSLIEQLASLGPEVGGTLAQKALTEGFVPELIAKWNEAQTTTKDLALGLVPEFLEAGRLSAIDTLNGLATQFGEDQRKFKRLGNKLGQQVGGEFKARALKEIADAVRQVEALATAARAEAVANAEREQARITEQAVAAAIANLIRNSDQRTGRNVQPVLQ